MLGLVWLTWLTIWLQVLLFSQVECRYRQVVDEDYDVIMEHHHRPHRRRFSEDEEEEYEDDRGDCDYCPYCEGDGFAEMVNAGFDGEGPVFVYPTPKMIFTERLVEFSPSPRSGPTETAQIMFLQYKDPHLGDLELPVHRFMSTSWSEERMQNEAQYYVLTGRRWSERAVLEILYYGLTYGRDYDPDPNDRETRKPKGLEGNYGWLNESIHYCDWDGVTCGAPGSGDGQKTGNPRQDLGQFRIDLKIFGEFLNVPPPRDHPSSLRSAMRMGQGDNAFDPPPDSVTMIHLPEKQLEGTLPSEVAMLSRLCSLDLRQNFLNSTIPSELGLLHALTFIDLSYNRFGGTIPARQLSQLSSTLTEFWAGSNQLTGRLSHYLTKLANLVMLDLSQNELSGPLPSGIGDWKTLMGLFLEQNKFTGNLRTELGKLSGLSFLRLARNSFVGTFPYQLRNLGADLLVLDLSDNRLSGTIPTDLFLFSTVKSISLGGNSFSGTIPVGDHRRGWSDLRRLSSLTLERNALTGTLPTRFLRDVGPSLLRLELGFNQLTGTIPTEIGYLTLLERLSLPSNSFSGTLPWEITDMTRVVHLNVTDNLLVGTVPQELCEFSSMDRLLLEDFGCDAILCPPGTFHPHGAASLWGGCRVCPGFRDEKSGSRRDKNVSRLLGQTSCGDPRVKFVVGDFDADGKLSPREILRLLFVSTGGENWGEKFQVWYDMDNEEPCDLPGITCVLGKVARIDLSDAQLCTNGKGKEGDRSRCSGLPAELGLLSSLEVLSLPRRQYLRGTIPTELGRLSLLRFLDLSNCVRMGGTIPSELGRTALRVLNISSGRFRGSIPTEIFGITTLEKLNLAANPVRGTLSSYIGQLTNLRELLISRMFLVGTLTTEIGKLSALENFECYGNSFTGSLPTELGSCPNLKRIDVFNNKFNSTIPETLANISVLSILHLKKNFLTGTLSSSLGTLKLSWLDTSMNQLSGTIPASLANLRTLKDLRLGGNRFYEPIPNALCTNTKINGGRTRAFGCSAVLCPIGTFHESGFATEGQPCQPCLSPYETTLYLGSTKCEELTMKDILEMFFDVMHGERWEKIDNMNWQDTEANICNYEGIVCDETTGKITEISFPLSESDI